MESFNPNDHRARCEEYLRHFLGARVRLVRAERLMTSSRDGPWRLDVEVQGDLRSYVLRLDARHGEHEYETLRAMAWVPIPTPPAYGWDAHGEALGEACFFMDFIAGDSLLKFLLAGERWAEDLYIDTACALQAVTREQVAAIAHRFGDGEAASDVLESAYAYFKTDPQPLADAAYRELLHTMPALPVVRFSNGDLYPDNMIVRDRKLVGVIDFQHAGFSDPIFEFLLPFFVHPELCGRGIEERYCRRMGFDAHSLGWYRGLEFFDTWHWVLKSGEPFVHHTAQSLYRDLEHWLDQG